LNSKDHSKNNMAEDININSIGHPHVKTQIASNCSRFHNNSQKRWKWSNKAWWDTANGSY